MKNTNCILSKTYILSFLFAAGVLLNFLIPPFQNPDEPQHFGAILSYGSGSQEEKITEKVIIQFMYKNRWPNYFGIGVPTVLPENFPETGFPSFSGFKSSFSNIALYHFILGKVQEIFFKNNITSSYYLCRLISFFFIIGSIFLMYLTFIKLSNKHENYLCFAIFFVLFLPQFSQVSLSVNSDSLSIFLSSLFFYISISLIAGNFKVVYFLFIIIIAIIGIFVDKPCFFLIPMLILVPFLAITIKKKKILNSIVIVISFFLIFVICLSWVVWYFPAQFYSSSNIIKIILLEKLSSIPEILPLNEFSQQFFLILADSFLLKFGWMAYDAEKLFYYVWRSCILFVIIGLTIFIGKSLHTRFKKLSRSTSDSLILKFAFFSLVAVTFQIIGLWLFQGSREILPQGRYFFPLLIPIAFIYVLGMKNFFNLFSEKGGQLALSVFILLEFFFFNYIIWNHIIPVFHIVIKSPHPGI